MHKLESQALSSASKIHKPFIHQSYTPIVFDRFICLSKDSINDSKNYDYYDDVVFHIKPYLDAENVKIIELGSNNENHVFYTENFKNKNINQSAYILNKSILYFGNYNIYSNIASSFNKKTICPINNDYVNTFKHYWGEKDKDILLSAETSSKPSFSNTESPKTINYNPPEEMSCKILDSLGISHNLNNVKTLHIGPNYKYPILDIFPSGILQSDVNHNGIINIRMDKFFDLDFLYSCASLKSFNIVTNRTIPEAILNKLKSNIKEISFFIDSKTSYKEIEALRSSGHKVNLFCSNKNELKKLRLKFIEDIIELNLTSTKEDFKHKFNNKLKFLSKKNILKDGQLYNSYVSCDKKNNSVFISNSSNFWSEIDSYRIYEEKP